MTPAPAWHPDPLCRYEMRYWDGAQWTFHVLWRGQVLRDPMPLVASPVQDRGPQDAVTAPPSEPQVAATEPTPASTNPANTKGESNAQEDRPGFFARHREQRRSADVQRTTFTQILQAAVEGDRQAVQALPSALDEAHALYRDHQLRAKCWEAMTQAIKLAIDDDIMTSDEEQHLHRLGAVLSTPLSDLRSRDEGLFERLVIAGINDGRFPVLAEPGMLLKRQEVAYGAFAAQLMREQAIRQYQGGSSGVSVPIGLGMRYRVSGVRGRSVVVGHQLVAQDAGVLYVTNHRALFNGHAKTLEFRHDRLVGLEQFTDGVRLNVTNRQAASLFRLPLPSLACALISAAAAQA